MHIVLGTFMNTLHARAICHLQNMLLWQKDYFELKANEYQKIQKESSPLPLSA